MTVQYPRNEGIARDAAVSETERRVLKALCQLPREVRARDLARQLLAAYAWREAAHQAVFEIVMSFPSTSTQALREQLPARLTRRGFPDFDFEALFESPAPRAKEAQAAMEQLRDSPRTDARASRP